MPCVDGSGELTEIARRILALMSGSVPLDELAQKADLPLYRIRAAVRELEEAGLAEEKDEAYVLTDAGRAALAGTSGAA